MLITPKSILAGMLICFVLSSGQYEVVISPASSYGLGSAEYLKGTNVLFSLFLNTEENTWTEAEKERALNELTESVNYIEAAAKDYHVKTDFIYDWSENEGLSAEATAGFTVSDEENYLDEMDELIADWVRGEAEPEMLKEKFEADGSALLVFVNQPGTSYAIVYDGTDNPSESAVLFSKEQPSVYTHEILHLFGAHDLYAGAEYSEKISEYVEKAYPTEIMYTVTAPFEGESRSILSPITAYHLGWIDYTEETDIFPQLIRENK